MNRALRNRHSGEGRNPGVGLPSQAVDASPPHPPPARELRKRLRRRVSKGGVFPSPSLNTYPVSNALQPQHRRAILCLMTTTCQRMDRAHSRRMSLVWNETPVSHFLPPCPVSDRTGGTAGVPFSGRVSHSPDSNGTQWDGMGHFFRLAPPAHAERTSTWLLTPRSTDDVPLRPRPDSPPNWEGWRDGLPPSYRTMSGIDSRLRGNDGGGGFGQQAAGPVGR